MRAKADFLSIVTASRGWLAGRQWGQRMKPGGHLGEESDWKVSYEVEPQKLYPQHKDEQKHELQGRRGH